MSFGSRSLPAPTRFESQRIGLCKYFGCVVCARSTLRRATWLPCADYHHVLVGGLRVGHRYGYPLCPKHHKDIGRKRLKGWGTDQELQDFVDRELGIPTAEIPARYKSGKSTATTTKTLRNPYAKSIR